jgi:hypothetical protein
MDPLPLAPACALDETGLREQQQRWARAGVGARVVDRTRRSLVVDLDVLVDPNLVEETIAVERECCPFFTMTWESHRRRLTVAVSNTHDEPALEAIAFALDLKPPARGARSDRSR